jgi:hypothetical protein
VLLIGNDLLKERIRRRIPQVPKPEAANLSLDIAGIGQLILVRR